jgi:hypothetical protein
MGAIWESPTDIRGAFINYFDALCTAGNTRDMV